MASRRLSVFAGLAGVSAGLTPYLPTVVCPGVACTSCFACIGAGGAAVAALVAGFVSRRTRPPTSDRALSAAPDPEGGVPIG